VKYQWFLRINLEIMPQSYYKTMPVHE